MSQLPHEPQGPIDYYLPAPQSQQPPMSAPPTQSQMPPQPHSSPKPPAKNNTGLVWKIACVCLAVALIAVSTIWILSRSTEPTGVDQPELPTSTTNGETTSATTDTTTGATTSTTTGATTGSDQAPYPYDCEADSHCVVEDFGQAVLWEFGDSEKLVPTDAANPESVITAMKAINTTPELVDAVQYALSNPAAGINISGDANDVAQATSEANPEDTYKNTISLFCWNADTGQDEPFCTMAIRVWK